MSAYKIEAEVNPNILSQCREQIGLTIEQAGKKSLIRALEKIEAGEKQPSFLQLERLASIYRVSPWVFLRKTLPDQYDFSNTLTSFRKFSQASPADFGNYRIRFITVRVEQLRRLILELREDIGEPVKDFSPPKIKISNSIEAASSIRGWLGVKKTTNHEFDGWKKLLDDKGIFIFCTSKYSDWSKAEPELFRGFCIYSDTLPVVVINNSDALSAQSFTLFHELGHLLRKESSLDVSFPSQETTEKWCDKFASELLMPSEIFSQQIASLDMGHQLNKDVDNIDKVAKGFKVSSLACAFRMREANKISWERYKEIEGFLRQRRTELKLKQQEEKLPIQRNKAREVLKQYGTLYAKSVVQAYRDNEIGLLKLCKLFGIKKTSDVIKLEGML